MQQVPGSPRGGGTLYSLESKNYINPSESIISSNTWGQTNEDAYYTDDGNGNITIYGTFTITSGSQLTSGGGNNAYNISLDIANINKYSYTINSNPCASFTINVTYPQISMEYPNSCVPGTYNYQINMQVTYRQHYI